MTLEEKNQRFNYLVRKAYNRYLTMWFLAKDDTICFSLIEAAADDIRRNIQEDNNGDKIKAKSVKKALRQIVPELMLDDLPLYQHQFIEELLVDESGYQYAKISAYLNAEDLKYFRELTDAICGDYDDSKQYRRNCKYRCSGHCMCPDSCPYGNYKKKRT